MEEYEETIKVRFWFDQTVKVQLTRNGVIIDKDMMDGVAADITPFVSRELFAQDKTHGDRVYSMASAHDVRLKGVREVDGEDWIGHAPFEFGNVAKKFAERQTDGSHDHLEILLKQLHRMQRNVPLNHIIALDTGDIGYTATVKFPIRKHHVIQGAYPKKGHLPANSWKGFVPLDKLPYVVNPSKGWLASTNNLVTSENIGEHAIGHAFSFE